MFPLGMPMDVPGPPYPLSEEIYHELLDGDWVVIWSEEVPKGERRTVGRRDGERLAVWKRRVRGESIFAGH